MNFVAYSLMTILMLTGILMIFIVLLQRGRGGGLAGAFGGMGGQSAFGTKAGDVFTKITVVMAVIWVVLAAISGLAVRAAYNTTRDDDVFQKKGDQPAMKSGEGEGEGEDDGKKGGDEKGTADPKEGEDDDPLKKLPGNETPDDKAEGGESEDGKPTDEKPKEGEETGEPSGTDPESTTPDEGDSKPTETPEKPTGETPAEGATSDEGDAGDEAKSPAPESSNE